MLCYRTLSTKIEFLIVERRRKMKVEFELLEKKFNTEDSREVKYYVLARKLVDGTIIEIPVKGDKSKLLLMSLRVENNK